MRKALLPGLCLLLWPSLCSSQTKPKLSPAVTPFVREDAPVVALTHVRVVDGTGAAEFGLVPGKTRQPILLACFKMASSLIRPVPLSIPNNVGWFTTSRGRLMA